MKNSILYLTIIFFASCSNKIKTLNVENTISQVKLTEDCIVMNRSNEVEFILVKNSTINIKKAPNNFYYSYMGILQNLPQNFPIEQTEFLLLGPKYNQLEISTHNYVKTKTADEIYNIYRVGKEWYMKMENGRSLKVNRSKLKPFRGNSYQELTDRTNCIKKIKILASGKSEIDILSSNYNSFERHLLYHLDNETKDELNKLYLFRLNELLGDELYSQYLECLDDAITFFW